MSIDGPQHGATQTDQPPSQRRTFLDLLGLEIRQSYGLGAGVVMREGCIVLYVADGGSTRSAEIACDMTSEGWWYSWATDGRAIAPVADTVGTAGAVARTLRIAQSPG
jgi:hypothetical protein